MVVQAAIPIITAVGEFTTPYLLRKAGEIGLTRFIQVYGSAAATAIGIQKTQPVDLQTEKILGMPVSHITGQGEVYDDTDYSAIDEDREVEPLKYIPEIHGGEPLPPIEQESFPVEDKIETWNESFKIPEKIETNKGLEIPPQEKKAPPGFEIPKTVDTSILTKDKPKDITKQTKDLVKEKPEFGALTEVEKQTAIALKGDKPDFYSRAIEAIKTTKDDKYTKGKWASILKSSTTKEELDYLGLTEFLKGSESITKQELLDFVKGKDLAATMTVRSVPEMEMNPLWEDYSLGGADTRVFKEREHIVFQKRKDADFVIHPAAGIYKEPHFNTEYGTDTFAHARVQVGYDPNITSEHKKEAKYTGEDIKFKKFDNTLIIDEIQSQWIQTGQDKGFVSDWTIIKGSDVTKEFIEENFGNIYELKISKYATVKQTLEKTGLRSNKVLYMKPSAAKSLNPQVVTRIDDDIYYTFNTKNLQGQGFDTEELAKSYVKREAIPDLPLKDSKKFVELVLNEMIRKAVKDDRDSIAITNGQIQYNRYEAMGEKERQGLKKFYDTFVYDQLNKIAKNYGVKLERIDIGDTEQAEMDQSETQMQFPRKIKTAQDNDYILKKITFQELFDRVQDTDIPGHAALYSNEGRGQGHGYIEEWFNTLIDNRTGGIPATLTTEEGLSDSGLKRWEKIRTNEVYVWKKGTNDIGEEGVISWDMPIVPVKDTLTNPAVNDMLNASSKDREYIIRQFTIGGAAGYPYVGENINNIDLIKYTEYLRNYKPPEGIDLGYDKDAEQLIKMKFPKKLKKDFYGKRIKLTKKINQQTDRMFG